MAISHENVIRMMAITSGELQESDFDFFRNHITPFVEYLVEHAIADLVRVGMDELLAKSMITTISELSKMSGANDLFDYGVSRTIFEEGMTNA